MGYIDLVEDIIGLGRYSVMSSNNDLIVLFHTGREFTCLGEINYGHYGSVSGPGLYCSLTEEFLFNHRRYCLGGKDLSLPVTILLLRLRDLYTDYGVHVGRYVYSYADEGKNNRYSDYIGGELLVFNRGRSYFVQHFGGQAVIKSSTVNAYMYILDFATYISLFNNGDLVKRLPNGDLCDYSLIEKYCLNEMFSLPTTFD